MRIQIRYAKEEEVPEAFRELYEEQEDGAFVLTGVDGMKTQADIDKLDKSLKAARKDAKDLKTKYASFGDVTPEKVQEMQDQIADLTDQLAAGGKPDEKALEPLIQRRAEALGRQVKRDLEAVTKERDGLKGEVETLRSGARQRRLQDALRGATAGEKGIKLRPGALEDAEVLAERYFTEDETGNPVTKEGLSGVTPGLSPSDWLRDIQAAGNRPHWFPGNDGAGADSGNRRGADTGPNPFTTSTRQVRNPVTGQMAEAVDVAVNLTEFSKLVKTDPKRAQRLAQKYGKTDLLPKNLQPGAA
jgi:hypothetical protein